jgi:hypothetical protein
MYENQQWSGNNTGREQEEQGKIWIEQLHADKWDREVHVEDTRQHLTNSGTYNDIKKVFLSPGQLRTHFGRLKQTVIARENPSRLDGYHRYTTILRGVH